MSLGKCPILLGEEMHVLFGEFNLIHLPFSQMDKEIYWCICQA